jgi:cob(I)alamin adenosyltransferase
MRVYIAQFVKGMHYSELDALDRYADLITLKQYGRDCFIKQEPSDQDIRAARKGFEEVKVVLSSGDYQMVILDEANIATHYNLFSADELVELVRSRPESVEVVITGRGADPKIIAVADLVTEMKEVKHYYNRGIEARQGIET